MVGMALRTHTGNLFDLVDDVDAIAHGCNTVGAMGAGIATEFRRRWPAMYDAYRAECTQGRFTLGMFFAWETQGLTIYNLATQPRPGPSANLDAIAAATTAMVNDAGDHGISTIAMPRIGAGLGGLDWADVAATLDAVAAATTVELIVVELPHRN